MDLAAFRPQRSTAALIAVCATIAVSAIVWKAWDMFGPSRRPMLQGWNDSFYYFWLPAVVINHDVDFSKPLAISGTVTAAAREAGLTQPRTVTHRFPNKYPPGWALGSLPFFLLAHALAPAGATGFEPIYLLSVWAGQMLYAALGLWLAALIIRRLFPSAPSGVIVLAVWLASPLIYYQSARLSLSHSQVFALAMAVFWLTLKIADGDRRDRMYFALGLTSALMVITRNIAAIYILFPAMLLLRPPPAARSLVALALGIAGPAALQMLAWKLIFGSWIAYSYEGERFDFSDMRLLDVLFSPRHGFFYWHPLMLAGLAALLWWSIRSAIVRPWIVSFVVITVLNAAWPCWWFASSFGSRGFEVPIFFAMVGLAALFVWAQSRPVWRTLAIATVGVAIAWNLALFGLFLTRRIPQETAVTYADDVRALISWVRPNGR